MSKTIYIGGRLESKEKGNVVAGANAILDDTKGKKQNVINKETDDELLRLEQSKQDNLTFDNVPTEDSTNPVTSGGVYTAEKALSDAIEAILLLIPSAATALNKLVDTNTMNSSISTATATFRGTYNAVSDLGLTYQATHAQIEAALDALGLTADNNDYAFVQVPVSDQSQDIAKTERYKNNGTNWQYEYDLNTSGFTAAQWAAINSGITVALVTKLTDLPTAAALQLALNAKQDTLTFDTEPTALSQNPVTSGGIYTAIQAIATALSDYSTTTDGRLGVLEGLIPSEAASNNKLTDKAYVDGLIQAITELIPAEATTSNQLADKAYVLASILAATPAFKGQFTTLAELQAVASPKAGDLGIVRTKDSDGMDMFTFYQYLNNAWDVFYSLSYHPQTKPATTGTTGDYPYNGMGRVELAKNMVNTGTELAPVYENQLTQDMFYKGAVGSRTPNANTIFVIRYDYVLAENITIPNGCVLQFDGGSISGSYTLTGANTGICAGLVQIFDSVEFDGTWDITTAYIEWYGTKAGDNTSVCASVSANKLFDISKVVRFANDGIYYSTSGTTLKVRGKLCGKRRGRAYGGGTIGTYLMFSGIGSNKSCVLCGVSDGGTADREKSLYIEHITIGHTNEGAVGSAVLEIGAISGAYITDVYCLQYNNKSSEFTSSELSDPYSVCNYGVKLNGDSEMLEMLGCTFEGDIAMYCKKAVDFFNVTNICLIAGGYGFASIAGATMGSAIHFRNVSMNQGLYGVYLTNVSNIACIDGFRIEQLRSSLKIDSKTVATNLYLKGVDNQTIPASFDFINGGLANSVNGIYIEGFHQNSYDARADITFRNVRSAQFYSSDSYLLDTSLANTIHLEFRDCSLNGYTLKLPQRRFMKGMGENVVNGTWGVMITNAIMEWKDTLDDSLNNRYIKENLDNIVYQSRNLMSLLDISVTAAADASAKLDNVRNNANNNTTIGYVIDVEVFGDNKYGTISLLVRYAVSGTTIDVNSYSLTTLSKTGDDIFNNDSRTVGKIFYGKIDYRGGIRFWNYCQDNLVMNTKVRQLLSPTL